MWSFSKLHSPVWSLSKLHSLIAQRLSVVFLEAPLAVWSLSEIVAQNLFMAVNQSPSSLGFDPELGIGVWLFSKLHRCSTLECGLCRSSTALGLISSSRSQAWLLSQSHHCSILERGLCQRSAALGITSTSMYDDDGRYSTPTKLELFSSSTPKCGLCRSSTSLPIDFDLHIRRFSLRNPTVLGFVSTSTLENDLCRSFATFGLLLSPMLDCGRFRSARDYYELCTQRWSLSKLHRFRL